MTRRVLVAVTTAAVALVALALPALAHVEVTPEEAPKGGTVPLTFRVPNERDDAATVKVEIVLRSTFATVTPQPVAGWTESVAGDRVTWTTAPETGLKGDAEQAFAVTLGPLPGDADSVTFPVLQTYSNGEVVRWIDPPRPGGGEPDFPAPALRLTGPAVTTTAAPPPPEATTSTTESEPTVPPTGAARDTTGDDDGGVNGALVAAIVVAAIAVVGGAIALGRRGAR